METGIAIGIILNTLVFSLGGFFALQEEEESVIF